jgi:hypothetical protein
VGIYLKTRRLILRHLTESDVDLLLDLDADPAVKRLIGRRRRAPAAGHRLRVGLGSLALATKAFTEGGVRRIMATTMTANLGPAGC